MKKILLALSLVAISTAAFAAGEPGTGVLGSVHDMRAATVGAIGHRRQRPRLRVLPHPAPCLPGGEPDRLLSALVPSAGCTELHPLRFSHHQRHRLGVRHRRRPDPSLHELP